MKPEKTSAVLFVFIMALAVVFSGCVQRPVMEKAGREADMAWQKPSHSPGVRSSLSASAMRPAMDWVPAGSFRPGPRTPQDVTSIVIHTTEGRYDYGLSFARNQADNYRNTIRFFQNNDRSVSAHFVIGPDGAICQMVREEDVAHTQTYYNGRSIGIECAGWGSRAETWTPEMMDSLVKLTVYLCLEWGVPPYHPAGTAYQGPNRVVLENGDQRFTGGGLVGHFQIQPWNKTDPGPHFPWEEFSRRVSEGIRELQ